MPLTKPQLAAMPLDQIGLNEREAEGLVESFYEEISSGESVHHFAHRRTPRRGAIGAGWW